MEAKLRSYFFTGNFQSLQSYTGKKSENVGLLCARAAVMTEKTPEISLQNLNLLAKYQLDSLPFTPASDALEELLQFILSFNQSGDIVGVENLKPDSPERIMMMAAGLLKLRRPEVAEKIAKNALAQEDEEGGVALILACACFMKGDFEEAGSIANELISKYGESPVLLNVYGLCLIQDGNLQKAQGVLARAVEASKAQGVRQYVEISLKNLIACRRASAESYAELEEELIRFNPRCDYVKLLKDAAEMFDQALA